MQPSTFRTSQLFEELARPPKAILTRDECARYSLARAINGLVTRSPASFEQDVSAELVRRGNPDHLGGLLIPPDVIQRSLNTSVGSQGGYLVGTENLGFVELARRRSALLTLGATVVEGLRGNVTFPRITTGITTTWIGAAAPSESNPVLGQISMTPKEVVALTEVSNQLMVQMTPSAERFLEAELVGAIGQAVDVAGIGGTGADGQPLGVANTPGIGSVSGTTLARAGLITMQVNAASSLSPAGGYVAPAATAEILANRETVATSGRYLWEGGLFEGDLAGYRAMASPHAPTGKLIFGGDWSTVVVGRWGDAIEVAVNPYANFGAGIVALRVLLSVDVAVQQPSSFTATTTVT